MKKHGLVTFTRGSVKAIDRDSSLVVIKPSDVDYEKMRAEDMVVAVLDGTVTEGTYNIEIVVPVRIYKKTFPDDRRRTGGTSFCEVRLAAHVSYDQPMISLICETRVSQSIP